MCQSRQLQILHRFGQVLHVQVDQVDFFVVEFGDFLFIQLHCFDELASQHGVDLQRRLMGGSSDLTLHPHHLHLDGGDAEEDSRLAIPSNRRINAPNFSIHHLSPFYILELFEVFVFELRSVFLEFFQTFSYVFVVPDLMDVVIEIKVEGNANQLVGLLLDVSLG